MKSGVTLIVVGRGAAAGGPAGRRREEAGGGAGKPLSTGVSQAESAAGFVYRCG